jgi:hypothetical protein
MRQAELFLLFTLPLDALRVEYMVSGSVASMVYGEPRLTNDIDIVLSLNPSQAVQLADVFPLDRFYCPPEEVIRIEARRGRRGHFNIIHHESGHKADIYVCGTDPLQAWGLANRRKIEIGPDSAIWVAPPEYVILLKLEYFREGGSEKHRSDIQGMLAVSGDLLDWALVEDWVTRRGLGLEWRAIKGTEGTATQ